MGFVHDHGLCVRAATAEDLPALARLKAPKALHRDRLRDAQSPTFRYLVLERAGDVIGFACLVYARPSYWSDAHDVTHLPQIVDVRVAPTLRGRGYGSYLILAAEQLAARKGCVCIYVAVDPLHNPRAQALYRRLGYAPLQSEPYLKHWEFVDSGGQRHVGDDWLLDMVKPL
ncbi:MAG: GNAT family N-acetyltransferase [Chloroflexota bacterium]